MDFRDYNKLIKQLIIVVLILFSFYLLIQIQEVVFDIIGFIIGVLIPIIFGFVMAYLLWPAVRRVQRVVKSRFVSSMLVYAFVIGFIIYILTFLIPQFISFFILLKNYDYSSIEFLNNIGLIDKVTQLKSNDIFTIVMSSLNSILDVQAIIDTVVGSIGGIISFSTSFLFSLIISIYALTRYEKLTGSIKFIFPPKKRNRIMDLLYEINTVIRSYFEGLIFVGVINAVIALAVYLILGLDYALNLALFLFLLYSIPLIGMILAGIPAVLIAFQDSPLKALLVIIFLIVITNVSSNLIEPKVFGSKIGVDPLVVLIGIIVVSAIFGFIGLLIAMPIVAVVSVIAKKVYETSKDWFDEIYEKE